MTDRITNAKTPGALRDCCNTLLATPNQPDAMPTAPAPCDTSRRDAAPATTRTYRRLATWLSLRGTHRWTVVDARTFCAQHGANPRILLRTLQTGTDLLTALTAHGVVS